MPQLGPVEDAGEGLWAGPYAGMEPQWSHLRRQAASHQRARDCRGRKTGGSGVENFRPGDRVKVYFYLTCGDSR